MRLLFHYDLNIHYTFHCIYTFTTRYVFNIQEMLLNDFDIYNNIECRNWFSFDNSVCPVKHFESV